MKTQTDEKLVVPKGDPWKFVTGTNAQMAIVNRRISYTTTLATATYLAISTADVGSGSEWGAMTGLYGAYRIRAIRVRVAEQSSNAGGGYLLFCTSRGTVPASTLAGLWQAENPELFDAGSTVLRLPSYESRATGAGDFNWLPIGSLPNLFGLKFLNSGSGTCTVFVEFSVEFRAML